MEENDGSFLSARKLFGLRVENPRGEALGRIEDIMISPAGERTAYAVVSFGGVLSLRKKLFAIPWSALQLDRPKARIILNLDKKTLANAHGFDKDHWPDSTTWNWGPAVPVPTPSAPAASERAAEPIPVEHPTSAGDRMEHWGRSWESHGLDRS